MTDERLKIWLNFAKFLLGSFALGIIAAIINSQIQNRQIDVNRQLKENEIKLKEVLQENENLSKYIDLALDKSLTKRRDFAKYFESVSKNSETRARWAEYVKFIEEEIGKNLQNQDKLSQHISQISNKLRSIEKKLPSDPSVSTPKELLNSIEETRLELTRSQEELSELRAELRARSRLVLEESLETQRDILLIPFSGVSLRNANLEAHNLSGVNLSGRDLARANLSKADLSRVDLHDADLRQARITKANLSDVNLRRANLFEADLSQSLLRGGNLSEANLERASLRQALVDGANLSGVLLDQAYLRESSLRNVILVRALAREADFGNANLQGADLTNADLSRSLFSGANLDKAILRGANFKEAKFLTQVQLDEACGDSNTILPDGLSVKLCK